MTDPVENWDEIAEWWSGEVSADPVYREDIDPMLRRLLATEAGPIVDLGCGEGQWLRQLARQNRNIIGCDRSERLLAAAAADHRVVAGELPSIAWLRDTTIGAAYSVFVLDLIGDMETFFAETARVVRPAGALVVIVNHPIFTAPDSGPFMDPDLDVFWRWGGYLERGESPVPAGARFVTMYHRPLGDVLTSAAGAGWTLEEMIETPLGAAAIERETSYRGQEGIPRFLGARWRR